MRISKAARVQMIRVRLNDGSVERTLDRELNVMRAAAQVERDTEQSFAPYHDDSDIPVWAGNRRRDTPTELREAIDLLAVRDPRLPAATVIGNRVSRKTHCAVRSIRVNGVDSTPEDAEVRFEGRVYSVPTHAVHPTRRKSEPRWSQSELDMELALRGLQLHYAQNTRYLAPIVPECAPYHTPVSVNESSDGRTVAMLARTAKDVWTNRHEADAIADRMKADRDSIRHDNPPAAPIAHTVTPGPVFGATFATLRPRAPWFSLATIPVISTKSALAY